MTTVINETFSAGTLGVFTGSAGTGNTVAHSSDIDHTRSGATPGSAKLSFGGSNGVAAIYNTTPWSFTTSNTQLHVSLWIYFASAVPVLPKRNSAGGGTDFRFLTLMDGGVAGNVVFSLWMAPDNEAITYPNNHYSLWGRWERATVFDFGVISNVLIQTNMWHRFWLHFVRNSTTGLMEYGIDNHVIGQTDNMNTTGTGGDTPDTILIGPQTNTLGRLSSGDAIYIDDIVVNTSTAFVSDPLYSESLVTQPLWRRVGET